MQVAHEDDEGFEDNVKRDSFRKRMNTNDCAGVRVTSQALQFFPPSPFESNADAHRRIPKRPPLGTF